jgi:hypothetical protein
MTLAEGQRLYQRYGSSALHGVHQVRPPTPDEPRDPAWAPLARASADLRSEFLRDTGWQLEVATEEARDRARDTRTRADIGRCLGLREAYPLLVNQADALASRGQTWASTQMWTWNATSYSSHRGASSPAEQRDRSSAQAWS